MLRTSIGSAATDIMGSPIQGYRTLSLLSAELSMRLSAQTASVQSGSAPYSPSVPDP